MNSGADGKPQANGSSTYCVRHDPKIKQPSGFFWADSVELRTLGEFFMIHMLIQAIIGLIIGIIAKKFVGGPHSLILTAIAGMAGGWVGGLIGRAFGWKEGHIMGFVMSIIGAILVLLLYQMMFH
jgi:uncharacterized membrane protein YeaQ/YmgE (transglycosylase-associated protein family)